MSNRPRGYRTTARSSKRALAVAADPFIPHGFVIISLAARFSTGSAINATPFSSGYFTKGLLSDDLVPDQLGDASASGIPSRTVLVLGAIVAVFTAYGSLGAITAFASLTFIIVFGSMSYLAFQQRDQPAVNPVIPSIGVVGTTGFFVLMLWHLYRAERHTFYAVILIGFAVLAVEILYFERDVLKEEIIPFADLLEEETPDVGDS